MLFLRFCLFCGCFVSFLPLLQAIEPRVAGFNAFAPQIAVGNTVLVLALLVFRRRLISYRLWAVVGLAAAIWSVATVWPEMTFAGPQPADGPVLKVANVNIWYDNGDVGQVVEYLAALDADIVGLVEVTPESKVALVPLRALYPHIIDCVDQGSPCQEMLLSKLPLANAFAGQIGPYITTVAQGDVVWQGRNVTITVTHIAPPAYLSHSARGEPEVPLLPGTAALLQSQQIAVLARNLTTLSADGVDRIVLGDFNSAPWSPMQRAFRAATGLENRGAFRGAWAPSWPSWHPFFARISIDPFFTGGALTIRSLKVGSDVGSDHRPVEAEIALKAALQ
jgi:endonuclease/exonuclease/phosphatase (EEP) superfamily protein YafD